MTETFETRVSINKTGTTDTTVILDANGGNITLGGHGTDGDVLLNDNAGTRRIWLDPGNHTIIIRNASNQVIAELGRNGNLRLGGGGLDGDIEMFKGNNQRTMHFDADGGNLWIGGNGTDGDIVLFPSSKANSNNAADATIHLDANAGDIILRNADCAEDFDVAEEGLVEPGMVMVIDNHGQLRRSRNAYDKRVAGVVSGAGSYKPGILLDRQARQSGRKPVALVGKVYCWADADYAKIRVGDLLTSSDTIGHAMRARDPKRSFGAVLGKALQPLSADKALLPILVALQ